MNNFQRSVNSKYFLWLILSLPWIVMVVRYIDGSLVYGEFIHVTGEFSARLLIVTMAVTPLRLMFPDRRWPLWLMQRRRYLGVAAFAYAVPHLAAYVIKLADGGRIVSEALEPGMAAGWLAFAIFVPLALTSTDTAARALGRRWKSLHRWVYAAAALTFAHWVLTAFDPAAGFLHLLVLALLEGYRVWKTRFNLV